MTIRTRLTLLFTGIVSTLLMVFCVAIYLQNEFHRVREFQNRLREEARTSAEILFGKDDISPDLLKLMDKNQMTVLSEEEIVIYDIADKIVYESGTDYLDIQPDVLKKPLSLDGFSLKYRVEYPNNPYHFHRQFYRQYHK